MRTLKNFKVEIIIEGIIAIIAIISTIHHIKLNGLYTNLLMEIIMYVGLAKVFGYIVKDFRKNGLK